MLSPNNEDRFAACWRRQNCYNCIHSSHGCGWCASSSTCVPASSLLEPVSKGNICPLKDERYELRTRALGCGCSTTTILSIIVTVFATIAALFLLYGIGLLIRRLGRTFVTGTWRGLEIEIMDDGTREENEWRRNSQWTKKLASLFRRKRVHSDQSEQDQITERSRLLG